MFGEVTEFFEQASSVQYFLSTVYRETGRDAAAESALRSAIQDQKKLMRETSDVPHQNRSYRATLASMLQQLGLSLRYLGRHEQAKASYREAIGVLRGLEDDGLLASGQQMRLGVLLNDLGVVYFHEREFDQAEVHYREALVQRMRTLAEFPNEIDHAACVGASRLNMGNLYLVQNSPQSSLPHYSEAISVLERVRSRDPQYAWANGLLRASYRCRAEAMIQLERFEAAIVDLDHLDEVHRQRWPEQALLPPRSQLRRAFVKALQGQKEQASQVIEQVVENVNQHGDETDLAEASYYIALVYAALARDQTEPHQSLALKYLREAVENGFDRCDVKRLEFYRDPDFRSLHGRDEFRQLLRERDDRPN